MVLAGFDADSESVCSFALVFEKRRAGQAAQSSAPQDRNHRFRNFRHSEIDGFAELYSRVILIFSGRKSHFLALFRGKIRSDNRLKGGAFLKSVKRLRHGPFLKIPKKGLLGLGPFSALWEK